MRLRAITSATILALALLGASSVSAFANGHSTRTYRASHDATPFFQTNCKQEARKPRRIVVACADGNNELRKIHWSRWGVRGAQGTATDYANDCRPYCASGHFLSYRAEVSLSDPRLCKASGVRQFTLLKIFFPSKRPYQEATLHVHFPCPTSPIRPQGKKHPK